MSPLTEQILEQKRLRRLALAQPSNPEKVRIVQKLRDASLRIAAAARQHGLRKPAASASSPSHRARSWTDNVISEKWADPRQSRSSDAV